MAYKTIRKAVQFFSTGIWRWNEDALSRPQALLLKFARVTAMAVKGFKQDHCALQASALTFYSLSSIVPVIAMAFGIAKGFGLEQRLEKLIQEEFAGQQVVMDKVVGFARSLLENTQAGLIAGIGVVLLFWSVTKVLGSIESAFNTIWKVGGRSRIRKFTDYLAIMVISPVLMIVSSSVTLTITTQVTAIAGRLALLQVVSPLIPLLLKLLPFGLIWMLFILLYRVMPNTQVRITSAVLSGVIAGSLFQILQGSYISAQFLISRYNAIYGSFAALPFFLVWLNLSWTIVLLGAEMTYAHQNAGRFSMTADDWKGCVEIDRRYALHILRLILCRFKTDEAPLTEANIADMLKIPASAVARLVENLRRSGLVNVVVAQRNNGEKMYQPARDIHAITIASAWKALDRCGFSEPPARRPNDDFVRTCRALDAFRDEMARNPENKLLIDI